MIRVRNNAGAFSGFLIGTLLLLSSVSLFADSVWEGSAAVGRYGEFPLTGYYAATNAFPRNTALVVENLETGKTSSVIVVDRMNRTGLFMLLSRDAASELGLVETEIAQVRVVVDKKSTDLQPVESEETAFSRDPDRNPSASVSGVEDLAFLEEYVSRDLPEAPKDPEPFLPPLEMELPVEETIEEIVEESPPQVVLTVEDVPARMPERTETEFPLAETPEAPAVTLAEAVLTGFDSAVLITPADRTVSRFVKIAPEPVAAAVPSDGDMTAAELPVYIDIPPVAYPSERRLASAVELPREPYFKAPEVEEEYQEVQPAGPFMESLVMAVPTDERRVSLSLASVPEEPGQTTEETPAASDYTAPYERLLDIAVADIPVEPESELPDVSGGEYLAAEYDAADFPLTVTPVLPEEGPSVEITEAERMEDVLFVEAEGEQTVVGPVVLPDIVESTPPEEEEEPYTAEVPPVPTDVDIFLEPADMRPPDPIEEITVVEETEPEEIMVVEEAEPEESIVTEEPERETVEEEPIRVVRIEEPAVAVERIALSAVLAPATHYLQLGVFSEEGTARVAASQIGAGYPVTILKSDTENMIRYKLFIGPLSPDESGALLYRFRRAGYSDAFVRVTN